MCLLAHSFVLLLPSLLPPALTEFCSQFRHEPDREGDYHIRSYRSTVHVAIHIRLPTEFCATLLQHGFTEESHKVSKRFDNVQGRMFHIATDRPPSAPYMHASRALRYSSFFSKRVSLSGRWCATFPSSRSYSAYHGSSAWSFSPCTLTVILSRQDISRNSMRSFRFL